MTRVLVVEDDAAIRAVLVDVLSTSDYTVETASDGAEALEKVRREVPDVVLLDLMMPVMDGWTFVRACRRERECQDVPIAVMSAARDLVTAARELGAQEYVPKPFDLETLLAAVERLATEGADAEGSA